jgi:SAM-dependent methyltransferase
MAANEWNASGYDKNARFVSDLGAPVLQLLEAQDNEAILDLGCGDGALTQEIAGRVTGIDQSQAMVDAARARGVKALLADMHSFNLGRKFDAVFTNAVLHWTHDIDAVLGCVARHLPPGGRFVGEFGGFGNVAALETAWRAACNACGATIDRVEPYYPTPGEFGERLAAAGFSVVSARLIPRPTPLPTGMRAWFETFRGFTIRNLPPAERDAVLRLAVELVEPSLRDTRGNWTADYVRLRFQATLATAAGQTSLTAAAR